MDAHELTRLRQKYQDAKGDDIFDPAFKQAAASLFRARGQRKLPYAGIPPCSMRRIRRNSAVSILRSLASHGSRRH